MRTNLSSLAERRSALLRQAVEVAAPSLPTEREWPLWLGLARQEGVVSLLYSLVDSVPTDITDVQRGELQQVMGATMCRCVELEHHLLEFSGHLEEAGIECVALKGAASAHLDHVNPERREVSDIDLLVAPRDFRRAVDVALRLGWSQGYALPRWHERYTHAVTLVRRGMELDLHQHIAHRAIGQQLDTAALISSAEYYEMAGQSRYALSAPDRMVHAAVHAVASGHAGQRLSSLSDILVMARRLQLHAVEVIERADEFRVGGLVRRGVRDAFRVAALPVPESWVSALEKPGVTSWTVDFAYRDGRRRPLAEDLAYLAQMRSWADRGRYVAGYLMDERDDRVRYLWSKLRGRGPSPTPSGKQNQG